ncbi:NOD26-like intrinsic protein 1 [Rhynchospora pubera]|uniref:NOD26-like intrinsic protein 1 n=1 Tax=Rhynchospora pubera TaxID=906938 RepID=A0AAV8F5S6_9POAL|nr:NOD26-like intrinsic protein 1 [Rhynchospora pubera]KAJ4808503.1 NOD26-like intrinsic protein 1 [Rhynchospora pubera]
MGKGENSAVNGTVHDEVIMEEGRDQESIAYEKSSDPRDYTGMLSVQFAQKITAEILGTYFMVFAGCSSVTINQRTGVITFPGICIVWGLVVMVMVYSVGHISGAHFNPAVSIAFATCRRFPWKEVPAYIVAQLLGSVLACGTALLLFRHKGEPFHGTLPTGTDVQSVVVEFIISFYLMFVISGVATDSRAIGELAGLAVGFTVLLNVFIAGSISGASMNPARSLGSAIVQHEYRSIWVYIVGPTCGTVAGAWAYNLIRFTNKPLREITKSTSFLKSFRERNNS